MYGDPVWVPLDDALAEMAGPELWGLLEALKAYKARDGRGKSETAMHVKTFCRDEAKRVRRALRRKGLPTRPPDRPWSAWWNKQKGEQHGTEP
jgi:hypothetical protein